MIDTFLKLMLEKRAERLVLVSDQIPCLFKAEDAIELSMPALRLDMLQRIALEMTGESGREAVSDTPREGVFRAADGTEFSYLLDAGGGAFRIEVHAGGAGRDAREELADDPLARAVAEFTGPSVEVEATPPAENRGLMALIDLVLEPDVSDIFLSSGKAPRVRRNGVIRSVESAFTDPEQILQLVPKGLPREDLEKKGSADFAGRWELSGGSRRFRINVFRHMGGLAAAIRPIRTRIPSLAQLSLPADLLELASFPSGLVLVTGASGSGKSTTLAALVDHINRSRPAHVITIEDPVEFEHREDRCLIHQREVGTNVESFSAGLHAALRENPDVILLGELRDLATISAALTAAETGHLVLGTLHSGSATSAVSRIIDVFPGHQQPNIRVQLASSLRAVVSQRLVPARSKKLVPAIEKLLVTPAVANGIREGHDHYMRNAMLTGGEDGMITLERSLAGLLRDRIIDRETAMRFAWDQKALLHLIE
ncbi:PilT/PilU family type 4a pilus ATPase [Luteolibacter marinus]|uniref:type IV pilus twitching motility protein PilT n=1 Tax=Luteolibacter marinus TaxID=2776705 RepID=UPI0031BB6A5D